MDYFLTNDSQQIGLGGDANSAGEVDWAVVISRIVICFVGILGNMSAMFVIVGLKEYKKAVTHWYVLQLAIADSIFLLTLPFKMAEDIRHEWIYSSGMCKAKETILFLNYYASILFLMIMSIDRYVAVCHGFSDFLQKFRTHRAAYVITAVTWVISLLLCTPIMLYSDKIGNVHDGCMCTQDFPKDGVTFDPMESKCNNLTTTFAPIDNFYMSGMSANDSTEYNYEDYTEEENFVDISDNTTSSLATTCDYNDQGNLWKGFLIFNFILMFVLPIIVMVFCYTKIIMQLHSMKSRKMSDAEATKPINSQPSRKNSRPKSASAKKQDADRNRVTFTCAAMVSLFFACWCPFHALHIAKIRGIPGSGNMSKMCGILFLTSGLLAYMNSAINPYIYNFLGTKFFRRFRNASTAVNHKIRSSVSYSVVRRKSKSKVGERKMSQSGSTSNSHTGVTKIASTTI